MSANEFEKIRPYRDHEIQKVLSSAVEFPSFKKILAYLFPQNNLDEIINHLKTIDSIEAFQSGFMHRIVKNVLQKTSNAVSVSGLENLDKNKPCLFLSNHRDILLDSAILQLILFENGFNTTEIAFGDNLMSDPLVSELGRCNRMFIVFRGGNPKEVFQNSMTLSSYIRNTLIERKTSVWIAQRNGRSKDGNDKTEPALLKMLGMSGESSFIENLKKLNIIPVSISYEKEPCDIEKALEVTIKSKQTYTKAKNEDLQSIIKGITQDKGQIHLAFGSGINYSQIKTIGTSNSQIAKEVALLIDQQIHKNYRLWPNNYIAHDLLSKNKQYSTQYNTEQKQEFLEFTRKTIEGCGYNSNLILPVFLGIYANPVINAATYKKAQEPTRLKPDRLINH